MPLAYFVCGSTHVSDLSPLRGMPLTYLHCGSTQVSDLSPLQGMALTTLRCDATQVFDLSPLKGMNLAHANIAHTQVSDLSPLQGMPLTELICRKHKDHRHIAARRLQEPANASSHPDQSHPRPVAALQKALPNCKIEWDDPAKPKTPEPAASGKK